MTHPKTRDEFEKNKVPIPLNANDINEEEFFQQTLPDTRKTAVNHIIRVVRGDKEYLLSDETIEGYTLEGNRRALSKRFGIYPFPYFVRAYNPATGRSEANGRIDRWEERYEIPSSPSTIKKLFAKDEFGTNTGMTIDIGGMQIAVMNKQDFINLPGDKLVAKITGKDVATIVGTPQTFVTSSQEESGDGDDSKVRGNSQQEQEAARRRMYDFSSLVAVNSSSTFGPTEEQIAAAQPTLVPQPVLNIEPSTKTPTQELVDVAARQETVEIEQKEGEKQGEKKGVGQSRATNRISENVGVVLKNEDTGVKQNMTRDSITIEEPQGQAAKKQREQDEKEEQEQIEQQEEKQQQRRR